ncbi:winged helix-turn-helix domain-containing protein [Catellatospora paridis]|uniref:winged helix-turn-helix domain-containing protein n=1 Tax=Catellatospora paridis TaxID=1617086 RepID=UPI0012D3C8DB|nr:helix-turn-helix domain-containing protein [Catellatospora paridis]
MDVSDPTAIRALAHPLRLDLLELLTASGPATAAHCGRILGVPQANCSFHLRQLARYGFVEDAGPGRDQRERRWRVPEGPSRLRIPANADKVVRRELERVVVERETRAILAHVDRKARDGETGADRPTQRLTNAIVALTAAEADELWRQWQALLEPHITRTAARGLTEGQHYLRLFAATTPMTGIDPEENDHGADG